jgi:two-component system sensor histidine kinase HydH
VIGVATSFATAESSLAGLIDPTAALQQILTSGQRISNVISERLHLVRRHNLSLEEAEVSELVHEAVAEVQLLADARKIALEPDCLPSPHTVVVDRALVVVALVDLIRNSLDAIGQTGSVVIRCSRSEDRSANFLVITDTGPEIPEDLLARVTEPYFGTKASGTGLGLAVVQQIAEAHGGRLSVKNNESHGAEITIELPSSPRSDN